MGCQYLEKCDERDAMPLTLGMASLWEWSCIGSQHLVLKRGGGYVSRTVCLYTLYDCNRVEVSGWVSSKLAMCQLSKRCTRTYVFREE